MYRKHHNRRAEIICTASDFEIENGVLKKYKGPGGDVVIPEGVTSIGSSAFEDCSSLKSVTIPDSVTSIGDEAFYGCSKLETLEINHCTAKHHANTLGPVFPAGLVDDIRNLYPFMADNALKQYVLDKQVWEKLDSELQAEIFLARQGKPLASAYLNCVDVDSAAPLGEAILEALDGTASVKACNATASFMSLFCVKAPKELLGRLYGALKTQKNGKKAVKTVEGSHELMAVLQDASASADTSAAVADPFTALMLAHGIAPKEATIRLKDYYPLKPDDLPVLAPADGGACPAAFFAWLLTAHEKLREHYSGRQVVVAYNKPGLAPEAAEAVALLDPVTLQKALLSLADVCLGTWTRKDSLAYPICRYADEATMAELTRRAPKWTSSVSGIDAPPLAAFRNAAKYSNTRAAMLFAERYGELKEYATLRGMSEDELRDKYLSDVGLDEKGGKAYDLGNQTVTARLQKDLSFLFELPNGKTAKSLPKKGADPARYEAAKADYDEMRKATKKIVKSRSGVLFADFLSGRARSAADWREVYLKNPLLRAVAELLVWAQGEKTFTLGEDGPIDCAGAAYTITEEPVRVAHPMEMTPEERSAWQKYYNARGLKQPFLQVWEPVIDPATVKPDRYEGSEQPMLRFTGKDKHGIHSGNLHAYSEDIGFTLDDYKLDYGASTWRINPWSDKEETYTLGKFSFNTYTRRVNHIVSLLDKWTVEDRVRKDDVSVMELMDGFTLAQIVDYIAAAQEAQAVNVLALLLEYKNAHFADFDPMDEFTLD